MEGRANPGELRHRGQWLLSGVREVVACRCGEEFGITRVAENARHVGGVR